MNSRDRCQSIAQLYQEVEDLRLDRDVQGRDRLVGDHELGAGGDRPGDADALALAARELVRIARGGVCTEPDQLEQLGHAGAALGPAAEAMDQQRLLDARADPHARIERGVRVLKDDLHVAPASAQGFWRQTQQVLAVEQELAAGRLDQAQHGARERRLAATGFADDADGLAACLGKAHAVHGIDPPALDRKMLDQVLDLQDRVGQAAHGTGFQQAKPWPPWRSSGGKISRQRPCARGQRPANGQPGGRASGLGTVPGMVGSASQACLSGRRAAAWSPAGPSCRGGAACRTGRARRPIRRACRHTSRSPRRHTRRPRRDRG